MVIISGRKVLLVKPQTYMNLSGESIGEIMGYYHVEPENLIVIYDDFDIDMGSLRIRKKGSAGSHNGMKSVIAHVGSQDFPRVRVGIGSSGDRDWKDFVIGRVRKKRAGYPEGCGRQSGRCCHIYSGGRNRSRYESIQCEKGHK